MKDVDFDVDQFMKDVETVMGHHQSGENDSDAELEDGLSSDLDFGNESSLLMHFLLKFVLVTICVIGKLSAADCLPFMRGSKPAYNHCLLYNRSISAILQIGLYLMISSFLII